MSKLTLLRSPLGQGTVLLRGPTKSRTAEKSAARGAGVRASAVGNQMACSAFATIKRILRRMGAKFGGKSTDAA